MGMVWVWYGKSMGDSLSRVPQPACDFIMPWLKLSYFGTLRGGAFL
jgi:hypothetical protein